MEKYEDKIKKYKIENNFVSEIKIPPGAEDVYESGDLKKLKSLKIVNMAETSIKELKTDKLPESIEEICAGWCEKLKKYSLKGLKNLKTLEIAGSGIKKLSPEDLPESLEKLVVSNDQDMSEIRKDPRFKKLEIKNLW
ncbi:MAG: hypothetical protein QW244_00610 [Candidatus Pacearchaeota archaeon]